MIFDIRNFSLQEKILFSTVRIVTNNGSGTGFFYNFKIGDNPITVIVTNRHVIQGAKNCEMYFTKKINEFQIKTSERYIFHVDIENSYIMHPDSKIDLCILPIAEFLNNHPDAFITVIDEKLLPSSEELGQLKAIEDILMVGYPVGLMDERNNMPIVRKGITATHPLLDYNGMKEFVIDAACFPGSSGSPIFLDDFGNYINKHGGMRIGKGSPFLLGILYAGPQQKINGEIKVQAIPTKQSIYSESSVMINLGYVIKSSKISDFIPILKSKVV